MLSQVGLPKPVRLPAMSNTSLAAKVRPARGPLPDPFQSGLIIPAESAQGIVRWILQKLR